MLESETRNQNNSNQKKNTHFAVRTALYKSILLNYKHYKHFPLPFLFKLINSPRLIILYSKFVRPIFIVFLKLLSICLQLYLILLCLLNLIDHEKVDNSVIHWLDSNIFFDKIVTKRLNSNGLSLFSIYAFVMSLGIFVMVCSKQFFQEFQIFDFFDFQRLKTEKNLIRKLAFFWGFLSFPVAWYILILFWNFKQAEEGEEKTNFWTHTDFYQVSNFS